MIKKYILVLSSLSLLFCYSCMHGYVLKPVGFKYKYDGQYTGLDTLININGYYTSSERVIKFTDEVDNQTNYVMFYPEGLVCFSSYDLFSNSRRNPTWGNYILCGDTIKAQFVVDNGAMTLISAEIDIFLVVSKNEIKGINPRLKYDEVFTFHPLDERLDSTNWLLKKRWFGKKK